MTFNINNKSYKPFQQILKEIIKPVVDTTSCTASSKDALTNDFVKGFDLYLKKIASSSVKESENKFFLKEFEGLDVEGLLKENPKIEKIAKKYLSEQ